VELTMITLEEIKHARATENAARIAGTDWSLVRQQLQMANPESVTAPTDRRFIEHLQGLYLRNPWNDEAETNLRRMASYEVARLHEINQANAYYAGAGEVAV
jgi:hypothetical protein